MIKQSVALWFCAISMLGCVAAQGAGRGCVPALPEDSGENPDNTVQRLIQPRHDFVLEQAIMRGQVDDNHAVLTIAYQIQVIRPGPVTVSLFDARQAVIDAKLPGEVLLKQQGDWYAAVLPGRGRYRFSVQISSPVHQDAGRNMLALHVNPASISRLNVSFAGANLDVQAVPPLTLQLTARGKRTEVLAYPGSAHSIALNWAPQTAIGSARLQYHAQVNTLLTVLPGMMRTAATVAYTVTQGKMAKAAIELPSGSNVVRVSADHLRQWDIKKQPDRQILELEFSRELSDVVTVSLLLEEVRESFSGEYAVAEITCAQADRQNGFVAVALKDELNIREHQRQGSAQIDPSELPPELLAAAGGRQNISLAYRFFQLPARLSLHIERIVPDISCQSAVLVTFGKETTRLEAVLDYQINRAGVFSFECTLPQDMEIVDVRGEQIETWQLTPDKNGTMLSVHLRSKALGPYRLGIVLEKPTPTLYGEIPVPVFSVNNVNKVLGYIGVGADSSVRLKTKQRQQLMEVGLEELPLPAKAGRPALAYKFISQPYTLVLSSEKVDTRLTADALTVLSLTEGMLLGNSAITYTILFAGTDVFSFTLPEDVRGVDISGPGIKHKEEQQRIVRDDAGKEYRLKEYTVYLHTPVQGAYTLYCSYELNFSTLTEPVLAPALEVLQVERQSGSLLIGSDSNLQIEIADAFGLNQVDIKELPTAMRSGLDIPLLYGFKYVRAPFRLALEVKKHEDVSVLVAVVERAEITSVLSSDGQLMTQARYRLKNRAKQYLEMQLPQGASLWSTFVDAKPVKPSQTEQGAILIPLVKQDESERGYWLDIVYETKRRPLALFGQLAFTAPMLDIPQTNVSWNVYVPKQYSYLYMMSNLDRGAISLPAVDTAPVKPTASTFADNEYPRTRPPAPALEAKTEERTVGRISARGQEAMLDGSAAGYDERQEADTAFALNIASQMKQVEMRKAQREPQAITKGRQKGVLPIQISIPVGGRLLMFSKLSTRDELRLTMQYVRGRGKLIVVLILAGIVLSGVFVRLRRV